MDQCLLHIFLLVFQYYFQISFYFQFCLMSQQVQKWSTFLSAGPSSSSSSVVLCVLIWRWYTTGGVIQSLLFLTCPHSVWAEEEIWAISKNVLFQHLWFQPDVEFEAVSLDSTSAPEPKLFRSKSGYTDTRLDIIWTWADLVESSSSWKTPQSSTYLLNNRFTGSNYSLCVSVTSC